MSITFAPWNFVLFLSSKTLKIPAGINCEYARRSNFLFERACVLLLKKNLAFWELMHLSGEIKENFEEPESEANKGK